MEKKKKKTIDVETEDMSVVAGNGENCIEFVRNSQVATVAFSQGKYVSRIRKLAEKFPDECVIVDENYDGSLVAHIPTKWVKVNPPRRVSDEQKEAASERFKKLHKSGKIKRGKE